MSGVIAETCSRMGCGIERRMEIKHPSELPELNPDDLRIAVILTVENFCSGCELVEERGVESLVEQWCVAQGIIYQSPQE